MPDINKYRIAVIVLAIVVVALVVALIAQSGGNVPSVRNIEHELSSTTTAQTTTATGGAKAPSGGTSNYSGSTGATVGFKIQLTAPTTAATWTIATQNTISWDRAAGVAGQIELLNASTYAVVGVIIPQLGPNQTSYTWNTRDLLLSRTNPLKTTVTPGTYLIRLAFDGNRLSPVTSAKITIAQ